MNIDLISRINERRRPVSPERIPVRTRTASAEPRARLPDPTETHKPFQRKKTVAFGSTLPFSQTADGVLQKRHESLTLFTNRDSVPIRPPRAASATGVQGYGVKRKETDLEKTVNAMLKREEAMRAEIENLKKENAHKEERITRLEEVLYALAENWQKSVEISYTSNVRKNTSFNPSSHSTPFDRRY
ncbi:hypothetical protein L596_012467 [Steinernema carpocapsae]|uniref:Uncharacterized protein n=1 Tax=Steinernema carpocapsae TaxID=34508 RepID=A0A4U5NXH6_STECR|nr:hypothetical protein L596_012467 [Steinernema carpocapsae]